tara:strand:- start:676 stop:1359 length:684 start_codon:yes stop_codon:yes gene_type:complete
MVTFRDRITELRRVPASELQGNPKNWRRHPVHQREGLTTMLERIGYADAVIARETEDGLVLVDGHLRVDISPEAVIPVLVVDLSDAEADEVLATLDPLTSLAEPDAGLLQGLLEGLETDDTLQVLLQDISDSYNVSLTELLEQSTEAAYTELPEQWGGHELTPGAVLPVAAHEGRANLKAFMFYIEQDKYETLMETLFTLGEAWDIDTIADVVFEAVRRAGDDAATG